MPERSLRLMSTDHCSACEQALDLLVSMPEMRGHQLLVVEVAGNEELEARYGERLPVLVVDAHELGWPFSQGDVAGWLARVSREAAGGTGA